ncbi:Tar ligand binding domain-containing protein, partial [Burkholderia pseudomallei]
MFSKIKLASGLLGVLVTFCLFLIAVEGLGFWSLSASRSNVDALSNVAIKQTDATTVATQHMLDARTNLSRASTRMVKGDPMPTETLQHVRDQLALADRAFAAFTAAPTISAENTERAAALTDRYRKYHAALVDLVQFLESNNMQAFLDQPTQQIQDAYLGELRTFSEFSGRTSEHALGMIDTGMHWFETVGAVLLVLMLACIAGIYAVARRAVVAPLAQALVHFERIAQGRLDETVAPHGVYEIERLLRGLADMQASVAGTVRVVRNASNAIHLGAAEIASGNADLSARTSSQAASLEQTAASMEELTATVRQNSDSARAASALADDALRTTQNGGAIVDDVIDKMHGIARSSGRIAEIIAVIDGIAFQTNILALNAAVEAARAGEEGRGFA